MTETTTSSRDVAVRDALVEYVAAHSPRRRRALWGTALVLAGALAGAGASTAAFAATGALSTMAAPAHPSGAVQPDLGEPIAAPPGTQPGAPIVSALGEPRTELVDASRQVSLTDRPDAATHVRVTVTPLTPGGLSWGTDPGGNSPSATWNADDIASGRAMTWYDFPLDGSTDTLFLSTDLGFEASTTIQYLTYVPTRLAVNTRGETYGVEGGPDGAPDLIAVIAETPGGGTAEGYARAADLGAFSPDHPEQPSNPDEALEWQAERDERYPDGWEIPVFESDGVTEIGTFRIGG